MFRYKGIALRHSICNDTVTRFSSWFCMSFCYWTQIQKHLQLLVYNVFRKFGTNRKKRYVVFYVSVIVNGKLLNQWNVVFFCRYFQKNFKSSISKENSYSFLWILFTCFWYYANSTKNCKRLIDITINVLYHL